MHKSMIFAIMLSVFALGSAGAFASAQDLASCQAKAIGADGKALKGAAKTSNINKCMQPVREACEAKAIGKDGTALKGAARNSNIQKCIRGA